MIVIGVDSHKRSHTAVAADGNGRKVAEVTVAATSDGHLDLVRWAVKFPDRQFAIEDCRHLSRRLSSDLLRAGETVVRVPPKLMAGARRSAREPGKSDPIDALAVARAALREPDLPLAVLDGPERELRLLVDHREDLVGMRTPTGNRQLNVAIHRIAITQVRMGGPGRQYFDRRRAAGDSKREALRSLKRHISNEVFRRMQFDARRRTASRAALPAAA